MDDQVAFVENDVVLLKKASVGSFVANELSSGSAKHKVPELKQFGGTRNTKELENFLCDME